MIIREAKFITSAADRKGFVRPDKPMIAVCGKSNVGKSSFINMLAGRSGLARTSNTPGRTRLVNYFDFGPFVLADLPGYGFAKAGKAEKEKWGKLMDAFFAQSGVNHVFSLFDIRYAPKREDMQMVQYLYYYAIPFTAVATKSDKLGKSRVKPRVAELAAQLGVAPANVVATSAETGRGRDAALSRAEQAAKVFYEAKAGAFSEEE